MFEVAWHRSITPTVVLGWSVLFKVADDFEGHWIALPKTREPYARVAYLTMGTEYLVSLLFALWCSLLL
jgi:hypothetical protein